MSGALFAAMTGVRLVHVPYKSITNALTEVVGGHIPLLFNVASPTIPMVQTGRVRALAATSLTRAGALPDTPTVAESGVPGFEMIAWTAVFVPAGTPEPIIGRLNARIGEILRSPEFRAKAGATSDFAPGTPQQLGQFVNSEIDKWKRVVAQSKLEVE
jgi:tripartite-type tricarboxylate transporter receptor subunit TctC